MALDRFSAPTRAWFEGSFAAPTAAQEKGWKAISQGEHTLIHAPTGSGKTLAAFLWAIDRLAGEPTPPAGERCRVLYVSPMKALAYDIERNLRAPLIGIHNAAEQLGLPLPQISTAMRTGDTPAQERTAMVRHPPDILITTPESLYLMLTSQARKMLASVEYVIIDEIHSVAGTKRGSHLAITLERLSDLTASPPQRIGLSATQRPLRAIAEFLGGGERANAAAVWKARPVTVVDAPRGKELEIEIVVPVADMVRPEETAPAAGDLDEPGRKSIWPAVYPKLLEMVLAHTSTLLFVNSRSLAERLASEINRLAGEEIVQSHHGSVSREQRIEIESRLKGGELRGVVATSTLELGIDMAAVDLVVLVESPSSVARGLQRVGRAGHQVGAPSKARVFPKHRGDLLETAVVVERMYAGAIEETTIPQNPLDVLAQQLVAIVANETHPIDDVFDLVRRALPFRDLTRTTFEAVLDMLAGRYPSDEFAELRPRLVWDRVEHTLSPRSNARMLAVTNAGTIPDRGLYTVVLPEGGKIGELDEEMVYESRVGDTFVLGSSAWKISEVTHDRVIVAPAPGDAAAKLPFWHGDGPGRPIELGRAVGKFIRTVGSKPEPEAIEVLASRYRLDPWAAGNLARFIAEEKEATGVLPTDRNVVVQRFRDEIGDWRMVVLTPYGGRVHAPWALAARRRYRDTHGVETDVVWSDDGIILRFPDIDDPPPTSDLLISPDEINELVLEETGHSALFSARFREAAARALLLPRRRPGSRTPLWLQRRRAADLLDVARRFPAFPIVLETYREVLQDYFDLPALREVLAEIDRRTIRVTEVDLTGPSPFATSLMFDFIASYMYEYDAPLAEKRATALTLDRELLRELLGDPQFRDLLDADVIADVELELQRLAPERRMAGADALHDGLRQLGPLSEAAIASRVTDEAAATQWLEELRTSRRAVPIRIAGEGRWAAVEDLARLRDALGVQPPPGIPSALLEPAADPLGDVVGRYARTHAPFTADQVAADLGLAEVVVGEVLKRLEMESRVASGAYQPGGQGTEWVDLEVLRRLRRRSLAVLRSEIEAVEPDRLGLYLPAWHGIGNTAPGQARLPEVLRMLQGSAIPASILERDVLPARMSYNQADLDLLLASGEIVWVGRGAAGTKDGKISMFLRDHVPLLLERANPDVPSGEIHHSLRAHLSSRGASFFQDLYIAAGGGDPQAVVAALWDMVWSGEITNDTLAPLRAFVGARGKAKSTRGRMSSSVPPAGSGRWYLVADLDNADPGPAPEQRAKAIAEQLLERHGVVTRPAVLAEDIRGGFAGLYPVFATMEDAGAVRRGYFIESLGGAQFGLPGAIDRLRDARGTGVVVLAAADPANPYGAVLPWPGHESGSPSRRAGAYIILADGQLVGFAERGGRALLTFTDATDAIVTGLIDMSQRARKRSLTLAKVDGESVHSSALSEALLAAGFATGYKGLTYRPGR